MIEIEIQPSMPKRNHIRFLVWLDDDDVFEYTAELEPNETIDAALSIIKAKHQDWVAIEVSVFIVKLPKEPM